MSEFYFPDQLTLTCPKCNTNDEYQKGSNHSFRRGVFMKSQGLVTAQCPRGHQFSLPDEEAYPRRRH